MALLLGVLFKVLFAAQIAIIARSLFSWIDPAGRTPIGVILFKITDPILVPIRRLMPATGGIDFSPMAALLIIILLQRLLGSVAGGG